MQALRQMLPQLDLRDRRIFLANLAFMYQVIVASEDLLQQAARHCGDDLRAYLLAHLREELNHAEWLAEDLAGAGVDVRALPVSAEAAGMAGSQYYLIRHVDAAALLGYMAVLECFPMDPVTLEELEALHGAALCRTLRHHAEHDPSHGADVLEQIEKLSATARERVKQNAVQTVLYLKAAAAKIGGIHA